MLNQNDKLNKKEENFKIKVNLMKSQQRFFIFSIVAIASE
jgi:hypothetical protein